MVFNPDYIVSPGKTLLEIISERGISQANLALRMGRTPKFINEIISGEAPITTETALQFEQVLNIPAKFWNSKEAVYRERLARKQLKEQLQKEIPIAVQFPYAEMARLKWVPTANSLVEKVMNLQSYFGVTSLSLVIQGGALYRVAKRDHYSTTALSAWMRQGEIQAQTKDTGLFDPASLTACLEKLRGLTREKIFEEELKNTLAACGIVLVFTPKLRNLGVFGSTRWIKPDRALVQLSLLYRTSDNFWFSLFHEIGHLLSNGKREVTIDFGDQDDSKEKEANKFAADTLIPAEKYQEFLAAKNLSRDAIITFAEKINIGPDILVGRLQWDRYLDPRSSLNTLKKRFYLIPVSTT